MNSAIIKNPRITEKASNVLAQNVYTFDISENANKLEIKKAIFSIYKVKPVKVSVVTIPKKNTTLRGRPSVKGGGRKAYVYLKEGDKIEFV